MFEREPDDEVRARKIDATRPLQVGLSDPAELDAVCVVQRYPCTVDCLPREIEAQHAGDVYKPMIPLPIPRPAWNNQTTPDELHAREEAFFSKWMKEEKVI